MFRLGLVSSLSTSPLPAVSGSIVILLIANHPDQPVALTAELVKLVGTLSDSFGDVL